MSETINVTRSSMPDYEEFCAEIKNMWDSHWLTNMGVKHQTLEKELLKYLDVPYLTLFTNGHLALENMLEGVGVHGEIITTPYTFASTTHAIVRTGNTPVFCDINDEDYTIDVSKIESLITEKTVAVMPVHVYGNLCDIEAIDSLAKKYGLKVLYDAAHAFGVRKNGVSSANFGDVSMFSFHATKVFNTIEGGAVAYHDRETGDILYKLKNFGIMGQERVEYVGGNAKMNEFQAAMGLCNLNHVDEQIALRRERTEQYRELLSGVSGVRFLSRDPRVRYNHSYLPVLFDGPADRDAIFEALKKRDIYARKYFYPCVNAYDCYKDRYDENETPVARDISRQVLTLPLYGSLEPEVVEEICAVIRG